MIRCAVILIPLVLTACARPVVPAGQEPQLSPVGAGAPEAYDLKAEYGAAASRTLHPASLWRDNAVQLYRDRRAMAVGDIVTVLIDVNDQAALNSASTRSRNASAGFGVDAEIDVFGLAGEGSAGFNGNGQTSANGQGSVQRSERVRLSVAATVTTVYGNGNLAISGLQEMRVNAEMRVLGVQGIVRQKDISTDNTIRYDQIAEARVSYGGAGRVSEVQQPALLHQIYDRVSPF